MTEFMVTDQRDVVPKRLDRYRSFPVMARAADGTILVAYRDGRSVPNTFSHGADGDSALIRSDGKAWSQPELLYTHEGPLEEMGCELSCLADGRLLLLSRQWDSERTRTHATYIAASEDGGRTFSPRRPIDLPEFPVAGWVAYGKVIERGGGELLQGAYGKEANRKGYSAACLVSRNGGQSWRVLSWVARCEPDMPTGFPEPLVVVLPDGSFHSLLRTNGLFYAARSADEGRTWSDTQPAFEGMAGAARVLAGGEMLVTYRGIHEKQTDRQRPATVAVRVGRLYCWRVSDDGGASWGPEGVIDNGTAWQVGGFGMGDTLELPDGRVKVIYYTSDRDQAPWLRECVLVRRG